jgi:hypothetical protein
MFLSKYELYHGFLLSANLLMSISLFFVELISLLLYLSVVKCILAVILLLAVSSKSDMKKETGTLLFAQLKHILVIVFLAVGREKRCCS